MNRYVMRGDFVGHDGTRFREAYQGEYGTPGIVLQGGIACLGNLVLTVKKFLEILSDPQDDNPTVETRIYKYNLSVRGYSTVFRYDNEHGDLFLHPGHPDPHHKHVFDWQAGTELKPPSPVWVGANNWPHLDRVIEEAREWYYLNRGELPDPDSFPSVEGAR
jgi:Family of unknown function (DUF6516)